MGDLISRQAAIDSFWKLDIEMRPSAIDAITGILEQLPSAQPDLDEWCTDCSEYDQERHCCPRWNRVIRQALKDAQPTADVRENVKGEWITPTEKVYSMDGEDITFAYKECNRCHKVYVRTNDNFCPNCGADMRTAKQIIHDAIDNTPMAEDIYVGIKEKLHKAVEEA